MLKNGLMLAGVLLAASSLSRAELVVDEPANGDQPAAIAVPAPANTGTSGSAAVAPADTSSVLQFLNGDTVHGDLLTVDPKQGLTWKHADVAAPVVFTLANLKEIRLAAPAAAGEPVAGAGKAPSLTSVTLTNDDQFSGKLVEITDQAVVLETAYAGTLKLERAMVKLVQPGTAVAGYLFQGPTSLEGWVMQRGNAGAWSYKNGSLVSSGRNGFIGRDVALPDQVNVEFDLAWKGQPGFSVNLYADRMDNPNSNGYMLNVNSDYFSLYRFNPRSGSREIGEFNQSGFMAKGKAHFSLRVDKAKKSIALLINGVLAKQFTDTDTAPPEGKCVLFGCSQGMLRVSGIQVSKWDGKIETVGAAPAEAGTEDGLFFANGDKVKGKLKFVKEGKLNFVTAYATMDVPVDRVATVEFAPDGLERARRNAGDVQLVFPAGARVTLNLEKLGAGTVTGKSENFGPGVFKLNAFARLRFNLYDERQEAVSTEEGGGW